MKMPFFKITAKMIYNESFSVNDALKCLNLSLKIGEVEKFIFTPKCLSLEHDSTMYKWLNEANLLGITRVHLKVIIVSHSLNFSLTGDDWVVMQAVIVNAEKK